MPKSLVITEKPSVARDIADALGGFHEADGWFESDDHVVTFAVGHLFELLPPEEIDPKYKRWTLDVLPILPKEFKYKAKKGQTDRIRTIKKLLAREDVNEVINACDAGREGELIFREIVEDLGSRKPIRRLWLQSMTKSAIRTGFATLRPGRDLEGLASAAACRARSDWLIGMNATRALTKRLKSRKEKTAWSAGRVQTPTLAMLVERELEILAHEPRAYWGVSASFEHAGASLHRPVVRPGVRGGRRRGSARRPDLRRGARAGDRGARRRQARQRRGDPQALEGVGAAALRPHEPSARGQPPLRLVGSAHALGRAATVRAAQAPDLSAHRLSLPAERLPRDGSRDARRPSPAPTRRPARASRTGRAPQRACSPRASRTRRASSTTAVSRITSRSFRPGRFPTRS